jgi:hypothetical protein
MVYLAVCRFEKQNKSPRNSSKNLKVFRAFAGKSRSSAARVDNAQSWTAGKALLVAFLVPASGGDAGGTRHQAAPKTLASGRNHV